MSRTSNPPVSSSQDVGDAGLSRNHEGSLRRGYAKLRLSGLGLVVFNCIFMRTYFLFGAVDDGPSIPR